LAPDLLTILREISQPLCGSIRAKLHRFLVPLLTLCKIRLDPNSPNLVEERRIKGLAEHQRGIGAAGLGSPPQQNTRGGEIAGFEKILATAEEGRNLLGADWIDRRFCA
jgi:hypothetical protein